MTDSVADENVSEATETSVSDSFAPPGSLVPTLQPTGYQELNGSMTDLAVRHTRCDVISESPLSAFLELARGASSIG